MVICLEQGADLHMAQLMPLPLTVSCFSKIQIGFYISGTGSPERRVPELITGDVSHKPGGRLPLLSPGPQYQQHQSTEGTSS